MNLVKLLDMIDLLPIEHMSPKNISLNTCYRKIKTQLFEPFRMVDIGEKNRFIGIVIPLTFSKTYIYQLLESLMELQYIIFSQIEQNYIQLFRERC